MGYRSTLITQYYGDDLPDWFIKKYKDDFFIKDTLISQRELKMDSGTEIFEDYQKGLKEIGFFTSVKKVICVVLSEDGMITKVIISDRNIQYILMDDGEVLQGVWNQ